MWSDFNNSFPFALSNKLRKRHPYGRPCSTWSDKTPEWLEQRLWSCGKTCSHVHSQRHKAECYISWWRWLQARMVLKVNLCVVAVLQITPQPTTGAAACNCNVGDKKYSKNATINRGTWWRNAAYFCLTVVISLPCIRRCFSRCSCSCFSFSSLSTLFCFISSWTLHNQSTVIPHSSQSLDYGSNYHRWDCVMDKRLYNSKYSNRSLTINQ